MTIFLTVLKIIGIVLLIVLALILLLTVVIVFAPLCLSVWWECLAGEDGKRHSILRINASWLFHLFFFRGALYGLKPEGELGFLWKRRKIFAEDVDGEDDSSNVEEENGSDREDDMEEEDGSDAEADPEAAEVFDAKAGSVIVKDENSENFQDENDTEDGNSQPENNKESTGPIDRLLKRLKGIWESARRRFRRIKKALADGKLKAVNGHKILTDTCNQKAFEHLKRELLYLGGHTRLEKCRLELRYSMGAPDVTGITFGIFAMFPVAYRYQWQILPDFEASVFYGEGCGRLVIRLCPLFLIISFLRVLFDRNCRRLKVMIDKYF